MSEDFLRFPLCPSGESHRSAKRSVHSAPDGLFSHMSRECAEAVCGQNETSDAESSG